MEQQNYNNPYIKILDDSKVYGIGNYIIDDEIEAGEYYFWGEELLVNIKGRKAQYIVGGFKSCFDIYSRVYKKNRVEIKNGYMTPVNNIAYTYDKDVLMLPGHMYKVDKEIPQGKYAYEYISDYDDGKVHSYLKEGECAFDRYTNEEASRIYRSSGVSGVVETDSLTRYVVIINGRASLLEVGEFHPNNGPEEYERRMNEYRFRQKIEKDRDKKLNDLSKVFVGEYVYYYCSIVDPIAEVVLNNYFSTIGKVDVIDNFDHNDFTVNYRVAIRREDIDNQCILCFMFMENKIQAPSCYGITLDKVLLLYERSVDEEKNSNLYKALKSLKKNISKDIEKVLGRFEAIYPYHVIDSHDYYIRYISNEELRKYIKDDTHKYLYYYMWDNARGGKYESMYREIILKLAENGYISKRWKSEFSLYLLVKAYFQSAIYQYRTDWLQGQSLDIYIPELKLGIEYQGIQHYEAVDVFGGEEGLKATQERDIIKKEKCKENKVTLFEWHYTKEIKDENFIKMLKKLNYKVPPKHYADYQFIADENAKEGKADSEVICQYDLQGKLLEQYETVSAASMQCNIHEYMIRRACTGIRKSAGGYQWRKTAIDCVETQIPALKQEHSDGKARKVTQLDQDGYVIVVYNSIAEAVRSTGVNSKSIRDAATGKQKHAGGYKWKYID